MAGRIKLYVGPMFARKCLAQDTPVVMFDGRILPVQNVQSGDILMGDDSGPRTVSHCVTSHGPMFRISAEGFDDYVVNENHILSLVYIGPSETHVFPGEGKFMRVNDKVDIGVQDFLNLPKSVRMSLCAYRPVIDFPTQLISDYGYDTGRSIACGEVNRIPQSCLVNSATARNALLAGIMSEPKLIEMDEGLRSDLQFLVNSMGYAYRFDPGTGPEGIGQPFFKRMFSVIHVAQEDPGDYFGFELDGNHRFLLGDFTVTHNTSGMRDEVDKYRIANKGCCIVKFSGDTRYEGEGLTAHDGKEYQKTPIIITKTLSPILDELIGYDVIGIDEMQFFPDCVEVAQHLANHGKIVVCSGLDGDFRAKPFGRVAEMIAIAEEVIKLTAVCVNCCKDASFTHKIIGDDQIVDIGGVEKYIPLCRGCRWPVTQ